MTDSHPYRNLERQLRDVALPDGFLPRLQAAVADHLLQEDLRQVPLPAGFEDRLRDCVREVCDETVVSLPEMPIRHDRRRPRFTRRRVERNLVTIAATVFLFVSHALMLALLLAAMGQDSGRNDDVRLVDFGPLRLEGSTTRLPTVELNAARPASKREVVPETVAPLEIELAADVSQPSRPSGHSRPTGQLMRAWESGAWDPLQDVSLHLRGLLSPTAGAHWLTRRTNPRHAISWSRALGHSRMFVLQTDDWPPLAPADALGALQVPVSTETTSFEEACVRAAAGRWPLRERIRSEEFIAAVAHPRFVGATHDPNTHEHPSLGIEGALSLAEGPFAKQWYAYLSLQADLELDDRILSDLRVELRFDPEMVDAYRIVGYGAPGIDTLSDTLMGDQLRRGQTAGVLVELWFPERNSHRSLIEASVSWTDPRSRTHQTRELPPLSQAAGSSLSAAPVEHQAAMLAAETAALLAEEPRYEWHSDGTYRIFPREIVAEDLLTACRDVDPALTRQAEFQRLLTLLHQLAALRSARGM